LKVKALRSLPSTPLVFRDTFQGRKGFFYLHRYEGNKEIWKKIGPNAQEAVNAADFESTYLTARAKGIPVKQIDTPALSIKAATHGWLEDVKVSNRPETYELYEHTLRQFQAWNLNGGPHRINVADLTRKDFLEYRKWLLDNEMNSARTAGNKLTRISQWYRDSLRLKPGEGLITTKDTRLGVTDREPEIYTAAELKTLFNACVPRWTAEQILFRTFLVTGFREDEIRFLTWADLDWKNFTIKVTPKPEYDFVIKDHEERTVPVPPWDMGSLKVKKEFWEQTYKRKQPSERLSNEVGWLLSKKGRSELIGALMHLFRGAKGRSWRWCPWGS
jgi:integrase